MMGVLQAYKTYKLGGSASELLYSPATYGIDLSHKDMPRPREHPENQLLLCASPVKHVDSRCHMKKSRECSACLWLLQVQY